MLSGESRVYAKLTSGFSRSSCNRLRRSNHQPRHRRARLHAQFGVGDLRQESHGGEQSLYVGGGVTIATVQLQVIVDIRLASFRVARA